MGAATIGGGFLGARPAGGGTTQTAVNRSAGARTQFAELVTAAAALATLLLLAPLIALMPNAVLAAVVVVYSIPLIKPEEFRAIARIRTTEFYWAAVACLGVILLGTLKGIIVAVIVSLLALAQQASNPPLHVLRRKRGTQIFRPRSTQHADDESWPGLLVLRPEGRIFFANAERLGEKMRNEIQEAKPKVVILDCRAVIDIEYTALKMLELAEGNLRREGIVLWLTALNPSVLSVVRRSTLGTTLGRERMFFKLQTAVETYEQSLSKQPSPQAA
jgi:sulfate permease, SulP family